MAMRKPSKATSWKYDGQEGRKFAKHIANKYERREAEQAIQEAQEFVQDWQECFRLMDFVEDDNF